eukprot:scaffold14934_cov58-Cyclotella_meneghiniana.AAC.1
MTDGDAAFDEDDPDEPDELDWKWVDVDFLDDNVITNPDTCGTLDALDFMVVDPLHWKPQP